MSSKRIAIAGLGAIGRSVARKLADRLPGLALSGIAIRDRAKAQAWLDREAISCLLISLEDLPGNADLALECAPAEILDQICRPTLNAGKQVMILSAGALLPRPDLVDLARARGGQVIVPTGALIGFDAVCAAAEGTISTVQMITRKPPAGPAGAPYLIANGISMDGLDSALYVFIRRCLVTGWHNDRIAVDWSQPASRVSAKRTSVLICVNAWLSRCTPTMILEIG